METSTGTQRTFDDMGASLQDVPFVVLDLETTGATPRDCEITEIGAVRYEAGELTGTFQTLVDPGAPIPPTVTILTGITHAMLIDAPRIGEALPALLEFIGDAVIVGHNIRFDMSFLNAAAVRLGYGRLPNRTSDTVALARRLLAGETRNLKLATVARHLRSPVTPTHRALDDAKATAHVFFELLGRAGAFGVTHLDDLMRLPTASGAPHYNKLRLTDGLPRLPGVYSFHDRTGEVIYVGKAKELRGRVRSYFYGDRRRRITQMMRDLERIEHRVCPTEVEASVAELRLIAAHQPRYNRRSIPPRTTTWIRVTDERFPRLCLARSQTPRALAYLGPFRRRKTAEQVMFALWDSVPIRRCTGTVRPGKPALPQPACRFSQLGVAVCPCDGSVPTAAYDAIVSRLIDGIRSDPDLLLEPIVTRIRRLATDRRYEEAAELRDRHRLLVRTLETRRIWNTLTGSGMVWAETTDGESLLVEDARLAASWRQPDPPPLIPVALGAVAHPETPPTTTHAEEMWLLWKWLDRGNVSIVDTHRPLEFPVRPVSRLQSLAG